MKTRDGKFIILGYFKLPGKCSRITSYYSTKQRTHGQRPKGTLPSPSGHVTMGHRNDDRQKWSYMYTFSHPQSGSAITAFHFLAMRIADFSVLKMFFFCVFQFQHSSSRQQPYLRDKTSVWAPYFSVKLSKMFKHSHVNILKFFIIKARLMEKDVKPLFVSSV